jgi:hypothetical protein
MGCCISSNSKNDSKFTTRKENITAEGITPNVGFVIKTWRKDKTKAFINFFYHPFIKAMYITVLPETYDKKGRKCFVYGVQVPNSMYTESGRDIKVRTKMIWDSITMINKNFNDTLSLDYVTPRIIKGFMGAIIKDHDVPQEYRITKSK